jgi:ribonucleoside-diphosphate reductase alpha chain
MSSVVTVVKRDGAEQAFDAEKLNKWAEWAGGIGVDWSSIVLEAVRKCQDKCPTSDLHKALEDACNERQTEAYAKMAGRLFMGRMLKEVFGSIDSIPTVGQMYAKMVADGLWDDMGYSEEDLAYAQSVIVHSRDLEAPLNVVKQCMDKYAISDKTTGKVHETPQFVYMRMALGNMAQMPQERRMKDVERLYHYLSTKRINPPSPFSLNLGTKRRQYASCSTAMGGDTIDSLAAVDLISYVMTSASAGIGTLLQTRSKGDGVRNATIRHLGKLPYYRHQLTAVAANQQACYSDDTEVLTSRGFVKFADLMDDDKVAQVHGDLTTSFVVPLERQSYQYSGEMVNFRHERNMGINLTVTPNHRMAFLKAKKYSERPEPVRKMKRDVTEGWKRKCEHRLVADTLSNELAETFTPSRETEIPFGGKANGGTNILSPFERLEIAFQADGVTKYAGNYGYTFRFAKPRKIARIKEIFNLCGIEYSENTYEDGVTSFYAKVGQSLSKDFSHISLEGKSAEWCRAFLKEAANWDGSLSVDSSMDCATFSSTGESVIDFFQACASLCGAYSAKRLNEVGNEKHLPVYSLYVSFDRETVTGRGMLKEYSDYSGFVYCVTVPTGNIIVRRSGKTAVCGNSRGGANTMHYTVLDPEFFSLIRLKDVQQIPELQIIGLDYSLSYNDFFAERVRKNEDWMMVSYGAAPKLWEAMYQGNCDAFAQEFEAVKNNPLIKKEIVPARKVALAFLSAAVASGREYETSLTAMNSHTPFKEPIRQSNLCVAPETMVLTDKGHWPIKMLAGTKVNVWNGHEFSEVTPYKTSDASELVKVILSDGRVLECTREHKFYKAVGYSAKEVEVMAANLQSGDKLIKLSTPVIEGSLYLHKAYANGFYTGDGCEVDGKSRIYLYDEKRELLPMFEPANKVTVQEWWTYFYEDGLQKKFFVPSALYSVGSRLSWLAGLLDADGCVVTCRGAQTIQLVSVNREFLRDLQYMLQTLGVQAEVEASRILIATKGVQTLLSLGLDTKHLKLSVAKPDRCAMRFPTVAAVEHAGRVCETYCFTEPKRNRGVFNGVLTGQCQEINLVTNEYESPADLYKQEDASGEIGLCNIAAIDSSIVSDEEYEEVAYYTALSIDNVMSLMDYPFPHLRYTATRRRSIGVGITNLAYTLAKNGQKYDTAGGKKFIAKIAERHSFYLHKAGLKLAKERGCCEWAYKTKYPDGWLPIDTANKNAMSLFDNKLCYDWEPLRQAIIEQGGLRFSVLEAHMPCETSSGAAGHTNSLYPIRQHVMVKTSGNNKVTFIAPEAETLKDAYQPAWDVEWKDLTDLYAIVQCFTGQGISADYYVRYTPDSLSISGKKLLTDWLYRVKMGLKSRYYINTSSALAAKEESSAPVCDSCSL